jgi:hypothetical protein
MICLFNSDFSAQIVTITLISDQRFVSMRLYYYDNTPSAYEPPGFIAATDEQKSIAFKYKPELINIGQAKLPYHG